MTESPRNSRLFLVLSGVAITLLLAAIITLGSLRVPFEPHGWDELIALYALNTFIVAALLVFGLILGRTLVRLWAERRAEELGSRFKTKMVLARHGCVAAALGLLILHQLRSHESHPEPLVPARAGGRQFTGDCSARGGQSPGIFASSGAGQPCRSLRSRCRRSQPLIGPRAQPPVLPPIRGRKASGRSIPLEFRCGSAIP